MKKISNVKKDLLDAIERSGHTTEDIKCAVLSVHFNYNDEDDMREFLESCSSDDDDDDDRKYLLLPEGYENGQLRMFVEGTDVPYNTGFGAQTLFGYVMFNDSTWLERAEYDGAEWWEWKRFFVPEQCKRKE